MSRMALRAICDWHRDSSGFSPPIGRDFAADDDEFALGVGLAGHAAFRVLPQTGVQHGIGNRVADFVRMAFADGFGRKDETTKHDVLTG